MNSKKMIQDELSAVCSTVTCGEPLSNHTSWGIGGKASYFAEPKNEQEIVGLVKTANKNAIPFVVIGYGSNLLVGDDGVSGLVVKLGRNFSNIEVEDCSLRVKSGAYVPCIARTACVKGLTGVEHIIGIPGSFGGLVAMNGGSRRQNVGSVIQEVGAIDRKGNLYRFSADECGFGYRTSRFQDGELIVLNSVLTLHNGDKQAIRQECLGILRERRVKFPLKTKNCGSVFLSTSDLYEQFGPPGKVIEDAGLKGRRRGGVKVSEQHANFIINDECGTFDDVINLIRDVRETVFQATKFALTCEVRYLNEKAQIVPVSEVLPEME